MVQNVFNNDEWGLSVEITLRINSNTYLCPEILRAVESVLNCAFEDRVFRLAHDCKF